MRNIFFMVMVIICMELARVMVMNVLKKKFW